MNATMQQTQPHMTTTEKNEFDRWQLLFAQWGKRFQESAEAHDSDDSFVEETYGTLKENGFFSAAIPVSLGGGGLTHSEICELLRQLARHCSSSGLAASMHQHLLQAMLWKYERGQGGEKMLQKVSRTNSFSQHWSQGLVGVQWRNGAR